MQSSVKHAGMRLAPLAIVFAFNAPAFGQEAGQVQLNEINVVAAPSLTQSPFAQQIDAFDQERQDIYAPVGTNSYTIDQQTIDALPQGANTPIDKVLLQEPGVSQDSAASGSLHIRNEHANVQYRINGILLPDGVSGLGQFLDPAFIGSMTLIDGALPAQYGLHTAAVVDITTPSQFTPGGSVSMYGGSHATLNPSMEYGGSISQTQYFFTGQLMSDNVGIENPTSSYDAIHDQTRQGQFFGYVSTILPNDVRLSYITGSTIASFQIPDVPNVAPTYSAYGISNFNSADIDEDQDERSFYNVLALQKSYGALDTQLSFYSRYSWLHFIPDTIPDLMFNGVASDVYRESLMNGIAGDNAYHFGPHTIRFGFNVSGESTTAINNDVVEPLSGSGTAIDAPFMIPSSSSELGWLGSIYAQDEWKFTPQWTLNAGLRFDQMASYVTANQVSPRVSLTYKPFAATTFHAGYARNFTPPEQVLSAPTNVVVYNNTTNAAAVVQATQVQPERSNVFDFGVDQKVNQNFDMGVDAYYKNATNLIDDGQFGAALVLTAFNYAQAYNEGLEYKIKYHNGGWTAYGNLAWGIQRATIVSSNQYLFSTLLSDYGYVSNNYIYTDHDQTLTGSGGISYLFHNTRYAALDGTRVSVDAIYGSGLRAGDLNLETVAPYAQVNLGITHEFRALPNSGLGPTILRFDIVNVLDAVYEIRNGTGIGVFAPQYGPRRGFYGGITQKF